MFKRISISILILAAITIGVFVVGPTEPVVLEAKFDTAQLGSGTGSEIDAYLKKSEATVADIKPGAQKQVVWFDPATKSKQPYSLVYLHGFSATSYEIRPVPELIAKELPANIVYTRFKGHGRTGDAMAEATVNDWMQDAAEALAIGRATGEKVVVLATSTGATIATLAARRPELVKDVASFVMVAPNYAVQAAGASILTMPWARQILPKLFGSHRRWEPKNEEQQQWWSTRYPTVALLPMQAAVSTAATVDFEDMNIPVLTIFHPGDGVVKSETTREIMKRWGSKTKAKAEIFEVTTSGDPSNHVIAGDILSPENSQPVATKAIEWIKAQ